MDDDRVLALLTSANPVPRDRVGAFAAGFDTAAGIGQALERARSPRPLTGPVPLIARGTLALAVLAMLVAGMGTAFALGHQPLGFLGANGSDEPEPPSAVKPVALTPDLPLARNGNVSVQVEVSTITGTKATNIRSFSLTCSPPAGTLPFAARICDYIARYPVAMLDPYRAGGYYTRGHGGPLGPVPPFERVSVSVTAYGKETSFDAGTGKSPGPGPTAVQIYYAAANGDDKALTSLEPGLQCCMVDVYAPPIVPLIRISKRAPGLAALRVFPSDIGEEPCRIPTGRGRPLEGHCSVFFEQRSPALAFVATWPKGQPGSALAYHTWHVVIYDGRVVFATESGAPLPQPRRPQIERLIRIARRAPALAALGTARMFPLRPGVEECEIPLARGNPLPGSCSVSIKHPWRNPTITFVVTWRAASRKPGYASAHHTWRVVLDNDRVVSVTETGPPPGQI